MANFANSERALSFLGSEQHNAETFAYRQADLAERAKNLLREKGAYVLGIAGLYGGTDGVFGSANHGIRIIQGTEPVTVGDKNFIALRHGPRERDNDTYLVPAERRNSNYLRTVGGVIAIFSGAKVVLPYQEHIEDLHLEALDMLIDTIDTNLQPLTNEDGALRPTRLPHVSNYGSSVRDGQIVNLRKIPADQTLYEIYS